MEVKHYEFFLNLASKTTDDSDNDGMHALYVELNRLNGMYWIVCGASLLGRMHGIDVSRIIEGARLKLSTPLSNIRVAEMGGALRALSLVQLCILCDIPIPLSMGSEASEFLKLNFDGDRPVFWFDMRSLYCSLVILKLTKSLFFLDAETRSRILKYISESQAVLGGFGAGPRSEAHGGYTFCAVASLKILNAEIPRLNRLLRWLEVRLSQYNGRPGKPADSCYVWWASACLVMIGNEENLFKERDRILKFINFNCVCPHSGGFSKYPSVPLDGSFAHGKQDPDLLHTFLAIASNALFQRGIIDPVSVLPVGDNVS